MKRGLVSRRAAEKSGYRIDATSNDGKRLSHDESSTSSYGEVPNNQINHPTNQGKRIMAALVVAVLQVASAG